MKFKSPESHIHTIVRAVIFQRDDIVLCRVKGAKWLFLPGGHVEDGESVETALSRELFEEMGIKDCKLKEFIGACENIFSLDDEMFQHEVNLIFTVNVDEGVQFQTKENHIEFVKMPKAMLGEANILPKAIKEGVLEWNITRTPFFKNIC